MSKTGEWGDKTIIYLPGDGERRHEKKCEHYRPDEVGRCCKDGIVMKCNGAAHCKYYVAKKKTY